MTDGKNDCSLFCLFDSKQLNVGQHEESRRHRCQREKVLPQVPSSAMLYPSIIEDIFTGHGTHLSLIVRAELETLKFIDGEYIGGISKRTDPLDPREPMKDASEFN